MPTRRAPKPLWKRRRRYVPDRRRCCIPGHMTFACAEIGDMLSTRCDTIVIHNLEECRHPHLATLEARLAYRRGQESTTRATTNVEDATWSR